MSHLETIARAPRRPELALYLFLCFVQIAGAGLLVVYGLPMFNALSQRLGEQLPGESYATALIAAIVVSMQTAYWVRIKYLIVPIVGNSKMLNHVFLFLGRLSFLFGSAVFSLVFFRHLPEMSGHLDVALLFKRGLVFTAALFALFCLSLEIERLGHAFGVAAKK